MSTNPTVAKISFVTSVSALALLLAGCSPAKETATSADASVVEPAAAAVAAHKNCDAPGVSCTAEERAISLAPDQKHCDSPGVSCTPEERAIGHTAGMSMESKAHAQGMEMGAKATADGMKMGAAQTPPMKPGMPMKDDAMPMAKQGAMPGMMDMPHK